ncbi:MAG: diguanylate cyclase [Moraxellaceae bacterium]|nr:diguanylate cyclase [Moraxellaceae bacterium]
MLPHPAVLVVDDQNSNLVAMEAVFDGEPVEMVKASSGKEALKLLLVREFALVLLDVQMPELDGFEVAEIMRSNPRTEATPIIFLTAISKEQRYIFRGYETGAVDYLFKPIEPEILRSKVRVFLELDRKNRSLRDSLRLLQQERDNHQALLRSLSEGLLGITPSGNVFYANPAAEKLLGAPLADLIGRRLNDLFVRQDGQGAQEAWELEPWLATAAETGQALRDDLFLHRDTCLLAVELLASPLLPEGTQPARPAGLVVTFRDVSLRRAPLALAEALPATDPLTGLIGPEPLAEQLALQIAEANRSRSSVALLYVDLDGFRAINEGQGMAVGDGVLKETAARLLASARETDVVARMVNDEFVVLLPGNEPRRVASLISGKILQAFARVVDIEGHKIQIGTSIGISIYPDDSTDPDDLVRCGKQAMSQAKGSGRSNYRYYRG